MSNLLTNKLHSTSGETISEVLVGVLIVGLATVLFATMISVAVNISLSSTDRTTKTYEQLSKVDAATATSGSGTVTLTGGVGGVDTSFSVATTTSKADATNETSPYTFTRYWLPEGEN